MAVSILTRRLMAIILTSAFCLYAPVTNANAEENKKLEGVKWAVKSVRDYKGNHLGFIKFENGQLEGQSTCNSYSAVYATRENNNIEIYRLGVTQLNCMVDNKMEIEGAYLEGLEAANRYELKDNQLVIYDKEDKIIATYE